MSRERADRLFRGQVSDTAIKSVCIADRPAKRRYRGPRSLHDAFDEFAMDLAILSAHFNVIEQGRVIGAGRSTCLLMTYIPGLTALLK